MCPGINNLVVTFVVGNESHVVKIHNFFYFGITFFHQFFFFSRNNYIIQVERQTSFESHAVTQILDIIEELSSTGNTANFDYIPNDVAQRFFRKQFVDITHFSRNTFIE
ncbi:hypothetical protein SDC9_51381 [bioreactor metagenome]|uniref:Uncharacterized protein n=1 Tax=bioreactor metagenome TaxID=1076179 RepID=A0A644WN91_9ZZZZ